LPDRHIAWRDVIVGAVVTALLFSIGKSLIGWYLGSSAVASSYGAAGGLIVLLFWVYYSTQIFLLGAEFTKVYAMRHGSKQGGMTGQEDESRSANRGAGTKGIPTSSSDDHNFSLGPNAEPHMSMTAGHDPSLAQLEREAARNRAELMGTVDALQNRISPSAIKHDVQEYVREKKEGMLRSFEQRARENPLQTAAIAAGVAYPLWRIVTSIPVPLLLIGAGLALTRRPTRHGVNTSGGFLDEARHRVGETTDALKQKYEEVSDTVQQRVQQTMRSAQETAEQAAERISGLKSRASDSAESLTTKMGERLSQTTEAARSMGSDAISAASEMASSGYRTGAETVSRVGEQVMQAGQRTQETFVDTVQRHPMIVGAVGLAIGAAIAAALPATRQEEQVFGAVGGELKNKAREMASEGVEAVKGAAQDVYEDTLRHAKAQGLSPESVREAAKDIGEKVKSVMANATDASSGQSGQSSRSDAALPKATNLAS
jgi:F0F1-type ATP synthase membrane subunit b/b'